MAVKIMAQVTPQPPPPAPSVPTAPATPTKPKRRWLGRLFMLFVCSLAVAVWFAPMIVAETSLKQQIPKILFPLYPGTIEVGTASLGWLQPVVVHDLKAVDADGKPFLDVKEFSTSEPLWQLAISQANLGRLKLVDPQVSINFRDGGSNVEDILAKMMSGPPSSAPPSDMEVEVDNATLVLEHQGNSQTSTIKPVSIVVALKGGAVDELELTMGNVPTKNEASVEPSMDWLAFRFGSEPTQDGVAMTPGSKHVRLKAVGWTLEKLLPAMARIEPHAELAGTIDADARSQVNLAETSADWTKREWSWDGRITVKNFVLAGVAALKQDRVSLATTSVAGRLAAQQGRLSMDQAQLQTEVGELTATGDIPLAGLDSSPLNAVRSILGEQDYTIRGHLDLQKLAALLPNTLRVREGTQITSGRVDVNLKSEEKNSARTWTADATIDKLAATNQGQAIAWTEPFKLNMQAHLDQGNVTVDQMVCQSDFFKLTGQGSLTDAQFTASGDLTKLEDNLQRFIDLGLEKLAGKARLQGEIRRTEGEQISLTAVVQLDDFQWDLSKETVWREPRLTLGMHAAGNTAGGTTLKRIDSGDVKLTSGQDTLVASLQQPIDLSNTANWSMKAALAGDLRTWQNRLRPFVAVKGWQLGGTAKIDTAVTADAKQIEVTSLTGDIANLDARGPQWWVKEPQVKLETSGIWSLSPSEWTSPQTTLTATAIACRIHDLLVDLKPDGNLERITGDAAYRGDLDKLSRWKNQALELPTYTLLGTFEGRAHLVEHDSVITADIDTTVTKFILADLETLANQQLHWVALWREPELHLIGKGTYDITADQLQMETASVQADGLSLNVHGSLAKLSTSQIVDMKGELGYDWQIVSQRMGDSLKKTIQLSGKQTRPIAVKGSLASMSNPKAGLTDLTGSAGIGFDSATIEGLAVGPVDVSARLEQGICQFAPIATTIADGHLHLTPQIQLNRTPSLLVLPQEKVIDQVQITPELCNSWLKFVAPLLADSTQIDGQFSLDIAGGALPLSAPTTGELGGTLGIHHVKVRPGATAMQVMGVYEQIKALVERKPAANTPRDRIWMQMPEQGIPFKLAGGRVYHQNVTFGIGDGVVQSSGSVGMDETIDFVLLIPIQDDWAKDQKLLGGLKGKSLKVPLRGSLKSPQIDSRVLTELATQIGGTALEGAIGGAIEDKVDDLFKGKLKKFLPGQN